MPDGHHTDCRGVRLYFVESPPVYFGGNLSGLHVGLTDHIRDKSEELFLKMLLFVFFLQSTLLSLTQTRHRDDVFHPVGGGSLEDWAPEEVVRRSEH